VKKFDVAVLGAGISGLTAALQLREAGAKVVVLEERSRVGGCIKTWSGEGFLFELGPNTVLNNSFEIDEVCSKAGLLDKRIEASPAAKKRFIVRRGRLVPLPAGPLRFLTTRLFSPAAKLRLLKEPFVGRKKRDNEESIAAFVRRRLGGEFLDYAVGPFVSGVYAGDAERLSVEHAVPKIFALEREYGGLFRGALAKRKGPAPSGVMFSFPRGLSSLPLAIAEKLGGDVRTGTRVVSAAHSEKEFEVYTEDFSKTEGVVKARAVISALPAKAASEVFQEMDASFAGVVSNLPYADVAMVCLGFRREGVGHPLDGFGFLVPEVEERFELGCLFTSSLFPGRAPEGHVALTAFIGGAVHPERAALCDEDLLSRSMSDLKELLSINKEPVFSRIERWRPAIPQYNLGHSCFKEAAESCEREHPGLFVSGNLLNGVSVGNCITNASARTVEVLNYLSAGG